MDLKKNILLTGQLKGDAVDKLRSKLSKWFENEFYIISLDRRDNFAGEVEIIAKVNTSGMNHFYSYADNRYRLFAPKRKWIDKHGYTHFITDVGGDIIISKGALKPRR